jgi:DNA polymerase (family X)
MPVPNAEIAAILDQTAELLETKGESQLRIRIYRRAARTIEALPLSVASLLERGVVLAELPGIGKDLAAKISAIVTTERLDVLESLKRQLSGELGAIAAVPGLGPKRVKLLCDHLRVRTLEDLRRAAQDGRLRDIPGLGMAVEKKVLAALSRPQQEQRFKWPVADAELARLIAHLGSGLKDGQLTVAGSYRRRRATVGNLDLLVTGHSAAAVGDRLVHDEDVAEIRAQGPTRTAVVLRSGLQVDLRTVPDDGYGAALLYFTGSKAHNIALRTLAGVRGWKLNEYGLFAGKRRIAGATEEELYAKLGLAFIAPELREDRGEIALAKDDRLPRLIGIPDLRGDLHVHSNWTDGASTIADLVSVARARGYQYLAIADRTCHAGATCGLDAAGLARQIEEIDRLNGQLDGFSILKGIEVDVLPDGGLDLPDPILSRLDLVVAAVHSQLDLPPQVQTQRVVRAMRNPFVSVLAYPAGRSVGERDTCLGDVDEIIATAREVGCHLELSAEPSRPALDDVHAQAAKAAGVRVAISSDAHSPNALARIRFGVDQARRGWISADDVINTRPLHELKKLLKR